MRAIGAPEVPIFMAGGVWFLREWADWIDNPDLGPIAFQFGTRPLLTQESPISAEWKQRLLTLQSGDILLHRFSPTGFYSSAVRNPFLQELEARSERQISYARQPTDTMTDSVAVGARGREIFVASQDKQKVESWIQHGYTQGMKTPDETMIFVTQDDARQIVLDQKNCMGVSFGVSVFQLGPEWRWLFHRTPGGSAEFLHSKNAARYCPWSEP